MKITPQEKFKLKTLLFKSKLSKVRIVLMPKTFFRIIKRFFKHGEFTIYDPSWSLDHYLAKKILTHIDTIFKYTCLSKENGDPYSKDDERIEIDKLKKYLFLIYRFDDISEFLLWRIETKRDLFVLRYYLLKTYPKYFRYIIGLLNFVDKNIGDGLDYKADFVFNDHNLDFKLTHKLTGEVITRNENNEAYEAVPNLHKLIDDYCYSKEIQEGMLLIGKFFHQLWR